MSNKSYPWDFKFSYFVFVPELNSIGIYISTGVVLQTDKFNFSVELKAYNSYCIFFSIAKSVTFSNFKIFKGVSSSIP